MNTSILPIFAPMKNVLDIIIIGAGPTGLNCGIEAKKNGLTHLILEKGVLVNSIFHFPANMTFFSTSKKLEIGGVPFISHNEKPTRQEAMEYYRRILESYDLDVKFGCRVIDLDKSGEVFCVKTEKGEYLAKNVVIATGFYDMPRELGVPGEDLHKVKHYYDEVHHYIQQNVVVVGGANSACDVALETWSKGANVTMVVRDKELYPKVKYWILPNIQNRIKEGAIQAYFESNLVEIGAEEVDIQTPDGLVTIPNDYVLAMTGYKPDYTFLAKMGVTFNDDKNKTPIFDDESLETEIEGLYIAGVINAGLATSKLFIENTREHGKQIIQHVSQKA